MELAPTSLHTRTPSLGVRDPRGLTMASVRCGRRDSGSIAQELRERARFDLAGRLIERADPRLPVNSATVHSLSVQVLAVNNVDAGWRVALPGEAGQMVEQWDARGERRFEHDALLRPVAVFERGVGEEECCTERYAYGDDSLSGSNRCGRLVRQDDGAGSLFNEEYSLGGAPCVQAREFGPCGSGFMPRSVQDSSRHEAAPTGEEGTERFVTCWRYGPTGEMLEHTDAAGHVRRLAYTLSGQLRSSRAMGQVLMQDADYDAHGRIEREVLGNGVVTTLRYDPADGRLNQLQSARPDGSLLQHLSYHYDPVGNPLRIEDSAQPTRHFANQRIEPLRTFAYDTLYQLIEATGYEAANDEGLANYRETYAYDAAGNMLKQTHLGAQHFTREWRIDEHSNRSLPVEMTENFATAFDANGNLRQLQPGQALYWDLRNQLSEVRPVQREDGTDDYERYTYDASSQRLRKSRLSQAKTVSHVEDVRYLPGLQIRRNSATGEVLHVIDIPAGKSHIRLLHWQTGKPGALPNDQPRYELTDHLGSTTLELESQGKLISQELYYPYGGTAWSAARNAVEVSYRFMRYSGKERDATGLYDYGVRYYAPWLCRWINPDPAGEVDGLNRFRFVRNSPLTLIELAGLMGWPWNARPVPPQFAQMVELIQSGKKVADLNDQERVEMVAVLEKLAAQQTDLSMIRDYTEAGTGFDVELNNYLRGVAGSADKKQDMEAFEQQFSQLVSSHDVAYRVMTANNSVFGSAIKVGDVVMDRGYMSASAVPHNAIKWLEEWVTPRDDSSGESVMLVLDETVQKKIAATTILADHLLIDRSSIFKVRQIHRVERPGAQRPVTVVGLSLANSPARHDIREIRSGEVLLPRIEGGLRRTLSRRLTRRFR